MKVRCCWEQVGRVIKGEVLLGAGVEIVVLIDIGVWV